jgi:GxxExxY protein
MVDLIFKEEVYKIVGAAMEVHRVLGPGFLEAVYQEALEIEFGIRGILYIAQPEVKLEFKDHALKCKYRPDFICYEKIIVEIKAINSCGPNEEGQIINALKAAKKKVGVLINFGESSLYWARYVN